MKKKYLLTMVTTILGVLLLDLVAFGQGAYKAEWHTVDGGGGVSTGSIFTVRGTAGQPDAGVSSGETYTVQGGFWGGAQGPPTAVTLASFTATPVDGNILVEWETAMEIDTVGFNLYRSESPGGPYAKLNDTLIPSQSPGSVFGATYAWLDEDVQSGITYYYKLEDVEIGGKQTTHGPIAAQAGGPTAVILRTLGIESAPGGTLLTIGLIVCLGGATLMWRARRRT